MKPLEAPSELGKELLELCPFLREKDLIDGLGVTWILRLNQSLRVEFPNQPGYLIKKPSGRPEQGPPLAYEARLHQCLGAVPGHRDLLPLLPAIKKTDSPDPVLAAELIRNARPWLQACTEESAQGLSIAKALGRSLGRVHRGLRRRRLDLGGFVPKLPMGAPGLFWFPKVNLARRNELRPAQLDLLRIIQGEVELLEPLEIWRSRWQDETLIHGDIRSDNVLWIADTEQPLRLVDWEMARFGDPAWDLGAVLREFLRFWVTSMPMEADIESAERSQAARMPLRMVRPWIQGFWHAYLEAALLPTEATANLLQRSVAFSGVQLLGTAQEVGRRASGYTTLMVLLSQLGVNILKDPDDAAHHLYDLESPVSAEDSPPA